MSSRVLIVEDDKDLCGAIARIATRWGDEILQAHTVREALELLERGPSLMVIDVKLPDGDAFDVVEAASKRRPLPTMVAVSGEATPAESFKLAQHGVRAYLSKPLGVDELTEQVEKALGEAPPLEPVVAGVVGHTPLRRVQDDVRRTMYGEAIARSDGNRSAAARTLGVSRQAVQQMAHEHGSEVAESDADSERN